MSATHCALCKHPWSLHDDRQLLSGCRAITGAVLAQCGCKAPPPGRGHGHVRPNSFGALARCGGPGLCPTCEAEEKELALHLP